MPSDGKIRASAEIRLSFPSGSSAKAAYNALLSEADFAHRGGSSVHLDGKAVRVQIESEDPVSLRASINSYLRLMHIIKDIDEGNL